MKLPEQDGYYKYYDGFTKNKLVIRFYKQWIVFPGTSCRETIEQAERNGSYFIEPIEPIKL